MEQFKNAAELHLIYKSFRQIKQNNFKVMISFKITKTQKDERYNT
jgi:hypothetical protein